VTLDESADALKAAHPYQKHNHDCRDKAYDEITTSVVLIWLINWFVHFTGL